MNHFSPRGNAFDNKARVVADTRKPLYIVQILDTSGSMDSSSMIISEDGSTKSIKKIEQLRQGVNLVLKSLKEFEIANVMYKIFFQVIELNSYGKAVFPEFMPLSKQLEEIKFEAEGCTCLGNSLSTLKTYINQKYMPGYNKAVSVILMSDGWPTDVDGNDFSKKAYETVIDGFKAYLAEMDYARNVDLFSIAVGDDACKEMLEYFSGPDRFFSVDQCESIADKLDFVTRLSLACHTTQGIKNPMTEDDIEIADEEHEERKVPKDTVIHDLDISTEEDAFQNAYAIDITKCKKNRCKECIRICPEQAIYINSGMVVIDPEKCNGCGLCVQTCPYSAIVESPGDDDLDSLLNL